MAQRTDSEDLRPWQRDLKGVVKASEEPPSCPRVGEDHRRKVDGEYRQKDLRELLLQA